MLIKFVTSIRSYSRVWQCCGSVVGELNTSKASLNCPYDMIPFFYMTIKFAIAYCVDMVRYILQLRIYIPQCCHFRPRFGQKKNSLLIDKPDKSSEAASSSTSYNVKVNLLFSFTIAYMTLNVLIEL